MGGPQVTEMVQNPLAVSFPDFLRVFAEQLEPILLAQPGMLSIVTGVVVAQNGYHEPVAVSLAQWESLTAHEAFLASAAAAPFFATAKTLLAGPPTINHYELGEVAAGSLKSRFGRIIKAGKSRGTGNLSGLTSANTGTCVEIPDRIAVVLFGDDHRSIEEGNGSIKDISEAFTVEWHRHQSNESGSRL
jgi:quinol monooxygenase YgiN